MALNYRNQTCVPVSSAQIRPATSSRATADLVYEDGLLKMPFYGLAWTAGWDAERAKFTAQGTVSPKFIAPKGQPNYSPFTLIMGGRYDGPDQDTWAIACHFNLPPGFNDTGTAGLSPEA